MKHVAIQAQTHLEIEGIEGFFIRKVTKFGNSAKVDCPKEYLDRTVYLVIIWQTGGGDFQGIFIVIIRILCGKRL